MKTVKELREVITSSGGELVIGKLILTYKPEDDIDVHFDGEIVQWFAKDVSDEALLSDPEAFTVAHAVENRRANEAKNHTEKEELNMRVTSLEQENSDLKLQKADSIISIGKVEAYEKVLFGSRKVTLE